MVTATMNLKEIATRISAHLSRFEADPEINKRGGRGGMAYYLARAFPSGRYVGVYYISYQGPTEAARLLGIDYRKFTRVMGREQWQTFVDDLDGRKRLVRRADVVKVMRKVKP